MRFKLQEKFSSEIPKEIQRYLKANPEVVKYMYSDECDIDLVNASCDLITDPTKIYGAIDRLYYDRASMASLHYVIFVLLKSGEVAMVPYSDNVRINGEVQDISNVCIFSPELVSKAYVIYNSEETDKALVSKRANREKRKLDKIRLYGNGLLRKSEYPYNLKEKSVTDKSGYIINPHDVTLKLAKFHQKNYSQFLEKTYQKLQKYQQLIKDFVMDFDALEDTDNTIEIGFLYGRLTDAINAYNKLMESINTTVEVATNQDIFDSTMSKLFDVTDPVSSYRRLKDRMEELQKLVSKIEIVDFDW